MLTRILCLFAVAVLVSGCLQGPKQTMGAALGGAAGGWAGSQIGGGSGRLAATAGGAILGALVGSEVGRSMDAVDRMHAQEAFSHATAAPVGQSVSWSNPRTGHHGAVTPVREGYASGGAYCREFHQTIYVGGRAQEGYGTACRQPDGAWRITG